jgi:hypothetical protein
MPCRVYMHQDDYLYDIYHEGEVMRIPYKISGSWRQGTRVTAKDPSRCVVECVVAQDQREILYMRIDDVLSLRKICWILIPWKMAHRITVCTVEINETRRQTGLIF